MAPDSLNCNHIEVDVQPSWKIVFQGGSSRLTSTILGKWLIIWMPKSEMRSNFGCNHPYPPYPQWHPFLGGSIYIYIYHLLYKRKHHFWPHCEVAMTFPEHQNHRNLCSPALLATSETRLWITSTSSAWTSPEASWVCKGDMAMACHGHRFLSQKCISMAIEP